MTKQEVVELAAILVNQHGSAATEIARRRRDQHARKPEGEAFRLWDRIAAATRRLLRVRRKKSA